MTATFGIQPGIEAPLRSGLRIIVTSPPECGQEWLTRVLASMYGLDLLAGNARPRGRRRGTCHRRDDAQFSEGAIFRTHSAYARKLVDRWMAQPVHVITILRDPYDLYHALSARPILAATLREASRQDRLGMPMPGVFADPHDDLLAGHFERVLRRTVRWRLDERVLTVRYEDLRDHPIRALAALAARIQPVRPAHIEFALRANAAERMRAFASPQPGGAETHPCDGLDVFRRRHADDIELLGYPLR